MPWEEYKAIAQNIDDRYNLAYLAAERDAVIRGTEAALRWEDIEENADIAPFLQYVTAGDSDVRPEHAALDGIIEAADSPFWDQYYPPNDWGCRCSVRSLSAREAAGRGYDPRATDRNMKTGGANVKPAWRRNTGTGEVLPTRGTITDARGKQLEAADYGLRSASDIYDRAEGLPSISGEDPASYWQALQKKSGGTLKTATGLRVNLPDKLFDQAGRRADAFAELDAVLKNPDEVWQGIAGKGQLSARYVRYYQGRPVVVLVDKDMNVTDVYAASHKQAESLRAGVLIKRK